MYFLFLLLSSNFINLRRTLWIWSRL